jgi:PAS domain S-box-containing protein
MSLGNLQSVQQLMSAVDLIDVPISLLDMQARFVHLNPANLAMLGRQPGDLLGQSIAEILPGDTRGEIEPLLRHLVTNRHLHGTMQNVRADGSIFPAEFDARVRWVDHDAELISATIRDLTSEFTRLGRFQASAQAIAGQQGDLLADIVRAARELLGARYAALGVVEGDRLVRFIPDGLDEASIRAIHHWPEGKGLLRAMLAEQRTIRVAEIAADKRSMGFPSGHPAMHSFLGTPITAGGRIYGHLYFTDKRDAPQFTIADQLVAELFAAHAGAAIHDREQRSDLQAVVAERLRLGQAVAQAADSIIVTDLSGKIELVNAGFVKLYGYEPEDAVGRNVGILSSGRHPASFFDDAQAVLLAGRIWSGTIWNRRSDGNVVEVESVISPVKDTHGSIVSFVQTDRDVTRERALETALERDARDREAITSALEALDPGMSAEEVAAAGCEAILRLRAVDSAFVFLIDETDARVLAVAGRLAEFMPVGQPIPPSVARYLASRLAVGPWTETMSLGKRQRDFGARIAASGLHTVATAKMPIPGRAQLALVIGTHDPDNAARLVEHIPALATFATVLGTIVGPGLEASLSVSADRGNIRAIVRRRAFSPYFQPVVDLWGGKIVGWEALTRFTSGDSTASIFAAAQRSGLAVELECACLAAALEIGGSVPGGFLSLNISPAVALTSKLRDLLSGVGRSLVLEITEHEAVEDYETLRAALRGIGTGTRIAVDDAGAGYASLRHVIELRPDFVKLDVAVVRGIDLDEARQALVAGMVHFARKTGVQLVAEGIETKAELVTLRSLGVSLGQGYLLGRPWDGAASRRWPTRVSLPR